jgi:hypothetical protein
MKHAANTSAERFCFGAKHDRDEDPRCSGTLAKTQVDREVQLWPAEVMGAAAVILSDRLTE